VEKKCLVDAESVKSSPQKDSSEGGASLITGEKEEGGRRFSSSHTNTKKSILRAAKRRLNGNEKGEGGRPVSQGGIQREKALSLPREERIER